MDLVLKVILALFTSLGILFYLMGMLIFIIERGRQAQVRKIHWQLYGDDKKYHRFLGNTINQCVLCPVCKGFVLGSCWKEHINGGHSHVHYITPIEEEFEKAAKRLGDGHES